MIDNEAIKKLIDEKWKAYEADIIAWFSRPETYFQASIAATAIGIAYVTSLLLRHFIPGMEEPGKDIKQYSWRWYVHRLGRLIFPLLSLAFLEIAIYAGDYFFKNADIINAVQRVAAVWLLWVGLKALVTNPVVRMTALWILVPAALLRLFGWFVPVTEHLNQYGFSLGEVEITAYTVIKAILLFSIVTWLGRVISNTSESYIRQNNSLNRSTQELIVKVINIALIIALFIMSLDIIGIDLTALAVFSGAVGVGLGFGLQKIASNFMSGIILLTERSISIGNLVELDDGIFGYMRSMGARSSVIETFDGKEVIVPNEDFINSRVSNLTHTNKHARVDIPIGVAYDTDLDLANKLILEAAIEYENTSKRKGKEPSCYLREFGDSSINFLLTFWVDDVTEGRWGAQSKVMFAIWHKFKEHNIEIPFPQHDVHIKSGEAVG